MGWVSVGSGVVCLLSRESGGVVRGIGFVSLVIGVGVVGDNSRFRF